MTAPPVQTMSSRPSRRLAGPAEATQLSRAAASNRIKTICRHIQTEAASSPDDVTERVDKLFEAFFARGVTPGLAYGLVMDGKLVHTGGMGTLRVGESATPGPNSIFRIASMTKSFIAATVLLLRDEGLLRLDDLAEEWVPELKGVPLATTDSAPPTVRQLLSMNAGLPEDGDWLTVCVSVLVHENH